MANEDMILQQILSELKEIKSGQAEMKQDITALKAGQERIEEKVDNIDFNVKEIM